jgi:hypothetical protein
MVIIINIIMVIIINIITNIITNIIMVIIIDKQKNFIKLILVDLY